MVRDLVSPDVDEQLATDDLYQLVQTALDSCPVQQAPMLYWAIGAAILVTIVSVGGRQTLVVVRMVVGWVGALQQDYQAVTRLLRFAEYFRFQLDANPWRLLHAFLSRLPVAAVIPNFAPEAEAAPQPDHVVLQPAGPEFDEDQQPHPDLLQPAGPEVGEGPQLAPAGAPIHVETSAERSDRQDRELAEAFVQLGISSLTVPRRRLPG